MPRGGRQKTPPGHFWTGLEVQPHQDGSKKSCLVIWHMTSYVNMNENLIIASWVMAQYERNMSLDPMYHGLAKRSSVTLRSKRVTCTDMGECCSSTCSRLSSKCPHLDVSQGDFTIIPISHSGLLERMCPVNYSQTRVARWNYQRLLDLKLPDVILQPVLILCW